MADGRPVRRVSWFEMMTSDDLSELSSWDRRLWWVEPYLYLTSLVGFPAAFLLAVFQPWNVPFVAYGFLIVCFGFWPTMMVGEECHAQDRSRHGLWAMRAEFWLLLGGATRQALKAWRQRRRLSERASP